MDGCLGRARCTVAASGFVQQVNKDKGRWREMSEGGVETRVVE